ncbi:MAG: urea ABC transporter permease subunit UrtB [Alphaproteobacteria bacterium]|nr:urea ABC transporter permease subunit UrtB [Alphaproteobacteria bacterium]
MEQTITTILDASNYTLILLLVALGLAIIFGLMNVINMAHGELLMLGAYTLVTVMDWGAPFWLALACAPIVVGFLGLAIEELIIRRVYHRVLDTILATWGLSLVLKQAITLIFGPGSYSVVAPLGGNVDILGVDYPAYRLFVMAVAVLAVVLTFWLFFRTRFGLAARGAIANRDMAACLGVNTRRLDRYTFSFGAALAGLAGAAMAPLISIDPQMGLGFLVPAFLAVLIGGLGTLLGPIAGSVAVGATDNLTATFVSPVWAQLVVFIMAILVVRLFPRGLVTTRRRQT